MEHRQTLLSKLTFGWVTPVILKFNQTNQKKERDQSFEQTSCLKKSKTQELHLRPTTEEDDVIVNSIMAHQFVQKQKLGVRWVVEQALFASML